MLTKKHKKILYSTLSIVGVILVLLVISFTVKLYPIALVGSSLVSAREFDQAYAIAKKLDANASKDQVYDQLIVNVKKSKLVGKVNVDAELQFYKTGDMAYKNFLNDYFFRDEKLFEKYIVAPKAYDAMLAIKYNSDFGRNNDAYNKASNVLDKLSKGQTFDELAKIYSDDKISGQLGGDLGFVTEGQILPELEKAVQASSLGEVKKSVVVSRLGYHIIYPVETSTKDGQKVWHVKHILILTSGYDNWLKDQLDKIGAHKLMSI